MLGCETKEPYGPLTHTAQLLLDMIGMAAMQANAPPNGTSSFSSSSASPPHYYNHIRIRMSIYNAQQMEYPNKDQWDVYDGIIIPGSFSAAYDTDPWIERLKFMIQTEIVPHHRKTLGICFGHQIFAHSFSMMMTTGRSTIDPNQYGSGCAVATPSGPRAGNFHMPLTSAGRSLLLPRQSLPSIPPINETEDGTTNNNNNNNNNDTLQLYFTHGDMVQQIPTVAVNLGGDDKVPIQSVAYFATSQDADYYRNSIQNKPTESLQPITPYAITLQAHPEYSTSMELGIHRTLFQCMDAMERRRSQRPDTEIRSRDDTIQHFRHVHNDSITMMAQIGQLFGWF
jgi:GMP synthase-like glutamine amidotransferase